MNSFFYSGVFYYVLGNIRPIFRSSIRNIQLIAIAKTNDIKDYCVDNLLLPFIQEVNRLAEVPNTLTFLKNGPKSAYFHILLCLLPDDFLSVDITVS
jgi:hypothetical protein